MAFMVFCAGTPSGLRRAPGVLPGGIFLRVVQTVLTAITGIGLPDLKGEPVWLSNWPDAGLPGSGY